MLPAYPAIGTVVHIVKIGKLTGTRESESWNK